MMKPLRADARKGGHLPVPYRSRCRTRLRQVCEMFSSREVDEWAEAQVANAPPPSPETLARVAALLHTCESPT